MIFLYCPPDVLDVWYPALIIPPYPNVRGRMPKMCKWLHVMLAGLAWHTLLAGHSRLQQLTAQTLSSCLSRQAFLESVLDIVSNHICISASSRYFFKLNLFCLWRLFLGICNPLTSSNRCAKNREAICLRCLALHHLRISLVSTRVPRLCGNYGRHFVVQGVVCLRHHPRSTGCCSCVFCVSQLHDFSFDMGELSRWHDHAPL